MAGELKPGILRNRPGRFVESPTFKVDDAAFQQYENSFPLKNKAVTESQAVFKILASLVY